jgi:hypothetical protein
MKYHIKSNLLANNKEFCNFITKDFTLESVLV